MNHSIKAIKKLDTNTCQRSVNIVSQLAEHYAGQAFLWGFGDDGEQAFFPIRVGLPPEWSGLNMQKILYVTPKQSGYDAKEVSSEQAGALLQEPPALPTNEKQIVTYVTQVLSLTCWGVIQEPLIPKDSPDDWPYWIDHFNESGNTIMSQFLTEALVAITD